ncbi:PH domain-containing protein [Paenarthrobacter ilicis]|uniref:Membrane protein n=1 Tax=Paenarthrobacter ilicis TaxID=43665 RepID=A0ABX0TNX5_9MICC|nr:putative membrane protein [Paenarthrobacter ilicis]NIJ02826.1 putative membrane protein [Paenarthrobacter ilicis]
MSLEGTAEQSPGDKAVDGGWQRVHPASPFVRGWVALAAVGYFFGRDAFERVLQGREFVDPTLNSRAPWLLAGGALVLLVTVGGFVLSWYFTRYQVADGYVRVNTGFLFKQQRQARLDRVQAIDIVQPLLARIFGLAELKFEVADAGESAVRLAYLPLSRAKQLRAAILARAAGVVVGAESVEDIPEAPEHVVLFVPHGRLIGSLLLSEQTVAIVLGAAASVAISVWTENNAIFFALIPAILGIGAAYWSSFNKGYNFTAAISPDGIRLRYGLLDTQAQTVPPGRIQAVKVTQPPIWRMLGWYRMHVNVAGYGGTAGNENAARTTLLPVGLKSDVLRMMSLVLPDPGVEDPESVFTAGLVGLAPAAMPPAAIPSAADGFVTTPRRARLLAPLGWRRNGFRATRTALLIRSGRWWRVLILVPHQRTQSMALHQGPLARRFGVADLVLHTTAGPVVPRVYQAGIEQAVGLFDQQAARAREARKRQTSEQWLAQVAPLAPEVAAAAAHPQPAAPQAIPQQAAPHDAATHQQQEDHHHG